MRTALDSSVLIQLYRKQAGWEAWRDCLSAAAIEGELILSPVAFAEYSTAYPSLESARRDLERLHILPQPPAETDGPPGSHRDPSPKTKKPL